MSSPNKPAFEQVAFAIFDMISKKDVDPIFGAEYGQILFEKYCKESGVKYDYTLDQIVRNNCSGFCVWKTSPPTTPLGSPSCPRARANSPMITHEQLPIVHNYNNVVIPTTNKTLPIIHIPVEHCPKTTFLPMYSKPKGDSSSAPVSPNVPQITSKSKTAPCTPDVKLIYTLKVGKSTETKKTKKEKKNRSLVTKCSSFYKTGVMAGTPCRKDAVCDGMCKIHFRSKQKELQKLNDIKILDAAIKQAEKEKQLLPDDEKELLKVTGWTEQQLEKLKQRRLYKRFYTSGIYDMRLTINFTMRNLQRLFGKAREKIASVISAAKLTLYDQCQTARTFDIQHSFAANYNNYVFVDTEYFNEFYGSDYFGDEPEIFTRRIAFIPECKMYMAKLNKVATSYRNKINGLPLIPDPFNRDFDVVPLYKDLEYMSKIDQVEKRGYMSFERQLLRKERQAIEPQLEGNLPEGAVMDVYKVLEQETLAHMIKNRNKKLSKREQEHEEEDLKVIYDKLTDPLRGASPFSHPSSEELKEVAYAKAQRQTIIKSYNNAKDKIAFLRELKIQFLELKEQFEAAFTGSENNDENLEFNDSVDNPEFIDDVENNDEDPEFINSVENFTDNDDLELQNRLENYSTKNTKFIDNDQKLEFTDNCNLELQNHLENYSTKNTKFIDNNMQNRKNNFNENIKIIGNEPIKDLYKIDQHLQKENKKITNPRILIPSINNSKIQHKIVFVVKDQNIHKLTPSIIV